VVDVVNTDFMPRFEGAPAGRAPRILREDATASIKEATHSTEIVTRLND
jgi:hypothetical protein